MRIVSIFNSVLVLLSAYVTGLSSSHNGFDKVHKLFIDPDSQPAAWVRNHSQDARAALIRNIANQSMAVWLGDWNSDVVVATRKTIDDAKAQNSIPVLVVYNIPERDLDGYSAGGVSQEEDYCQWIDKIATQIGPARTIVIVEPDALSFADALPEQARVERFRMLKYAVTTFANLREAAVYLDAGHPNWKAVEEMSSLLVRAGIERARGFSINVSNFYLTVDCVRYGVEICQHLEQRHELRGKSFVVDTSRNGNGPARLSSDPEPWCNPPGRALGRTPSFDTNNKRVDAFLWIKQPGVSDGKCHGGPNPGVFWPDYAVALVTNAQQLGKAEP